MNMKHLLIEGYCDGEDGNDKFPCEGTLKMGISCLSCPKFSYSKCPNEIAISNKDGVVENQEDFIGFGGEMEPKNPAEIEEYLDIWREICREKISDAYDKYIDMLSQKQILYDQSNG